MPRLLTRLARMMGIYPFASRDWPVWWEYTSAASGTRRCSRWRLCTGCIASWWPRGPRIGHTCENQSQEGRQYILRVRTNRKRGGGIYSAREPIARGEA
eukprot:493116-Prorocentrum_minimum.AAC.2